MRYSLITLLCILAAASCFGAATYYYQKPDATALPDNARVLLYDPASGGSDQNITGLKLKQEIAAYAHLSSARAVGSQAGILAYIAQANSGAKLVKQASSADNVYARQLEVKNSSGVIQMYINASGTMVFGTPADLSVSSVYPINGATGVSNGTWFNYSTSGLGWKRINTTTPAITFNKGQAVTISTTYINGSSIAPTQSGASWSFANFSGVPGTTYTMTVKKNSIVQTDGQLNSSCGVMTLQPDYTCISTFTMQ